MTTPSIPKQPQSGITAFSGTTTQRWDPEQPPHAAAMAGRPSAPRLEKRQQQIEELCAASIRAFSGYPRIRFRGHRLELNGQLAPLRAPHLQPDSEASFSQHRGAADGMALRLKHSDHRLHLEKMPEGDAAQLLFELMEQMRVESLVDPSFRGMKRNVEQRFCAWCSDFHNTGMTENQLGLMIYTVAQMVWSRLTGNPPAEETEDLIEQQRAVLAPAVGVDLQGLRRERNNQVKFADHALNIANIIVAINDAINEEQKHNPDKPDDKDDEEQNSRFRLMLDPIDDSTDIQAPGNSWTDRDERQLKEQIEAYQVFNREFDREVLAASLVRNDQLRELREKLDLRIREQGLNIPRLARQLSRLLSTPHRRGWSFGHEEGHLDAKRLSQLVTSPSERRLFRQELITPQNHCQVSFLIDSSGSMKEHIESIAMMVDTFCRALEQAGACTEVLGFTTNNWNGGKPAKQWLGRGLPENPGRLCETLHMIYKDAKTSWRRGRNEFAAMLKSALFREGVDGEALQWAHRRLLEGTAERRILFVISDGCPMESATHKANGEHYLDNHLQQVAGLIEARGEVELYALGVGLDLSNYYHNNLAIDINRSLDNAVFDEVIQLLKR